MDILNIENCTIRYQEQEAAVEHVSLSVGEQEIVSIVGESGSGKTTLLNCISTIDKVTSGHIFVGGEDITNLKGNKLNKFRREELGFIFQDFNLLDTLTAYENIALALTIQKVNAHEIDRRVKEVAQKLNITEILNKYPYQISGGQKQRVAIARGLMMDANLILADEPTGALDHKATEQLIFLLKKLNKEGKTIVVVTHDMEMARSGTKQFYMEDGKIFPL